MVDFQYTPDSNLEIHAESAIRLLCAPFQSHEMGLPEWIKNSCDAYVRESVPEEERVVIVFFNRARAGRLASIACLDFVGMTSANLERDFRRWADPDASARTGPSADIQGGHGNGGKCYMVQMFDGYATLHTVRDGKGSRYGVKGGSVSFGYVPNERRGRDYSVKSARQELERALSTIDVNLDMLPPAALEILNRRNRFTLVVGMGARGYGRSFPANDLLESMILHPQMVRSMEMSSIYTVINRSLANDGRALRLPDIPPFRGTAPVVSVIPANLVDPRTGAEIEVPRASNEDGILTLRTSDVSMRYTRKARHTVMFRSNGRYVGSIPVLELDVVSHYRDRIYGELNLSALASYMQNDRSRLADSPLTRAVQVWISSQVQLLATSFEQQDATARDQTERNVIASMNDALDAWKNQFLERITGDGTGSEDGAGPDRERSRLPEGQAVRVEMQLSRSDAGIGVPIRPTLHFFDRNGERVRAVPYRLVSSGPAIAEVDPNLNIVTTRSPGTARLHAEAIESGIASNSVDLRVLDIRVIRLEPTELALLVGSRAAVHSICELVDRTESIDPYLVWAENDSTIVGVSPAGSVFAFSPGITSVTAGDDRATADHEVRIVVTAAADGEGGKRYPKILISEFQSDPYTGEAVAFGADEPPVMQRPRDVERNVWWINSASPLANLYLQEQSGHGAHSKEWRVYLLDRYIDVLAQLMLPSRVVNLQSLSITDWVSVYGAVSSEIQGLAVRDLHDFIEAGRLPSNG